MKKQIPVLSNDYETGMRAIKNNFPELMEKMKRKQFDTYIKYAGGILISAIVFFIALLVYCLLFNLKI